MSRTAHKKTLEGRSIEEVFAEGTQNIDARFHASKVDTSERPSAYKNALSVSEHIERLGLAQVNDRILPHGHLIAGDIDPHWKKKRHQTNA